MADFLQNNDETVLRYLDGEMNQTEIQLFEEHLLSDTLLQDKLQSLRVAIASVQQYGTAEKLRSIHSEMMQELSPLQKEGKLVSMRTTIRYTLAVAASIIIILVGVNLFTSSPSSGKLYNQAFVDYDASVVRGKGNATELTTLYQTHNYRTVIEKANGGMVSQSDSLLVGISYLKSEKPAEAINWLKAISAGNPVRQDAEFYLAMAYLKNKSYKEAADLMEQIHANPNQVYHNQFSEEYINKVRKLDSK